MTTRAPQTGRENRHAPLTVLITNIVLSGRTGTEIVTRDLALGLQARGHRPIVYTHQSAGEIADELRRAAIPVHDRIELIETPIDVIHGHHTSVAAVAVARFPDTPAIFLAHDALAWHDAAPIFPSIRRYLAVSAANARRLGAELGVAPDAIGLLLNATDIERFRPGPELAATPRRALAFAKNHGHIAAIEEACAARGIALDVVGHAVGRVIDRPEDVLGDYDLVFTSALSAIEAMATGRAVIACDGRGLAGMVTPQTFTAWRSLNFGLGCLTRPLEACEFLADIDRYDAAASAAVTALVRSTAGRAQWLDSLEAHYREVIDLQRTQPSGDARLATARHIETWAPRVDHRWPWLTERQSLIERADRASWPIERSELGVATSFAADAPRCRVFLGEGFSVPEQWGTWIAADSAVAMIRFPVLEPGCDIEADFDLVAFLPPLCPRLCVDVVVNGTMVETWSFDAADTHANARRVLPLSHAVRRGAGAVWLLFHVREPRSPLECGVSDDPRRLGLGLIRFVLRRPAPAAVVENESAGEPPA